jgi:TonB family protein
VEAGRQAKTFALALARWVFSSENPAVIKPVLPLLLVVPLTVFGQAAPAPAPKSYPRPQAVQPDTPVSLIACTDDVAKEISERKLEGKVTVAVAITADGAVDFAWIDKSSASEALDALAKLHVKQCKFRPAEVRGKPVPRSYAVLPLEFKLPTP